MALFTSGYALYNHPPGAPREIARQRAYAAWIVAHVDRAPASVLDVGCGNGSLLLALAALWPHAALRGLDPSPESVKRARDAGINASAGTLDDVAVAPAELVISVNVIEHAPAPAAFVRGLTRGLAARGTLALVCPDGSRAWGELVFADHVSSFAPEHLRHLLTAAGLEVLSTSRAPRELGPFQMVLAGRAATFARPFTIEPVDAASLARTKREYLERWRRIEMVLQARSGDGPLACFGIGEAAGLLRAYAPRIWARVTTCVADAPEQPSFGDLPVVDYAARPEMSAVLLGVRPPAQPIIASRLEADGHRVIRWDDLIEA